MNRVVFLSFMLSALLTTIVQSSVASLLCEINKTIVIPSAMGCLQSNKERAYFKYEYMESWTDLGVGRGYLIADTKVPRRVFSLPCPDVDSLVGFCRAQQLYRGPSLSARERLLKELPQQSWLADIYWGNVEDYQKLAVKDNEIIAAKLLAYYTCTDLSCGELQKRLSEIRQAIAEGTWTLSDAYVFLGIYPAQHYFGCSDISESFRREYAMCIADSLKAILVAQEGREWGEIVRRSKKFEADERAAGLEKKTWGSQDTLKERITTWGVEDARKAESEAKEQKLRQADEEDRKRMNLSQSELDRLHKLDVVRAYLFAERTLKLRPTKF